MQFPTQFSGKTLNQFTIFTLFFLSTCLLFQTISWMWSNCKLHAQSLSRVWLFAAHGLHPSRLLCHWRGWPLPAPGDLPAQGSSPHLLPLLPLLHCQVGYLPDVSFFFFLISFFKGVDSDILVGVLSYWIYNLPTK